MVPDALIAFVTLKSDTISQSELTLCKLKKASVSESDVAQRYTVQEHATVGVHNELFAPALCDCPTVSGISVKQHDRISFPWRTFEMKVALPPTAGAKTAIEPAALYETSLGDAPRRHYAHVAPNGADDFGTLGVANTRTIERNACLSLSEHMAAGLEHLGLSSWPKSASTAVSFNISRKICGISSDGSTRSRATPTHRSVICASTQNSAFSTSPMRVVDSLRHIYTPNNME